MGEQHNFFVKPEDKGHWEDKVFVFDEPIEILVDGQPHIIKRLDTTFMTLEEGTTFEDVLQALCNPVTPWRSDGESGQLSTGGDRRASRPVELVREVDR